MKDIRTSLVMAMLPHIVLSDAAREPVHGYAMLSKIRKQLHVYVGPSTLYPVMNQLETEGYLTSKRTEWKQVVVDKPHGKLGYQYIRTRRLYSITAKGRQFLSQTEATIHVLEHPSLMV